MTYKLICSGCGRYTSAIFRAYADGLPCPHCGVPLLYGNEIAHSYYAQLTDLT